MPEPVSHREQSAIELLADAFVAVVEESLGSAANPVTVQEEATALVAEAMERIEDQ